MARKWALLGTAGMVMKVRLWFISDDNWILSCLKKEAGENFYGEDVFELIHENT